jgi:hypothetical protein
MTPSISYFSAVVLCLCVVVLPLPKQPQNMGCVSSANAESEQSSDSTSPVKKRAGKKQVKILLLGWSSFFGVNLFLF